MARETLLLCLQAGARPRRRPATSPKNARVLERIIEKVPAYAPAQKQLGALAARSGDQAAAEQQFRSAVRADPSMTTAWIGLASTLAAESKISEAKDAVNTALRLDPENAQAQALASSSVHNPSTAQERP